MGHSSEEETDISDSELENYSEKCYQQLRDGKFEVKISGEVYRCPYCSHKNSSHKKRKQQCGFDDLIQHASAFGEGSGFDRDTKEKGKHLGLVKYLAYLGQRKSSEGISPVAVNGSPNSDNNELFVYPWVGIVANIPVTFEEGKYVMGSGEKLRSEFMAKGFNPMRVTPLWNYTTHICFAVVEFSKGWPGFHCAMKFEKSFEAAGKGKLGYSEAKHWGTEVYGWIGRKDDYYSEKAFGDFLRKFRDLKAINNIEAEEKRKSKELLSDLSNIIADKNKQLRVIEVQYNETLISLNNLTTEKDKMFQAYSEDTKVRVHNIVKEHQKMKTELELREKELQKREARNDEERKKLAIKNEMNERAERDALEKKKAYEQVIKSAEAQKREIEVLHKRSMELEKQVIAKQGLKLEIECMRRSLSVMEHMKKDKDSKSKQKTNDTWKALQQKENELEDMEALNQTLVVKERKTSDELQEARKELIDFLRLKSPQWFGLKRLGELDFSPFLAACKKKYVGPEPELEAMELFLLWHDHLKDPHWHPFKIVALESGNHKEIINEEDEKLKKLKAEWDDEVWMAVTTAIREMNEYDPSGRHIISELWNYREGRKATLAEGVSYLLDLRKKRVKI